MKPDRYLTTTELARVLGVSRSTVVRAVERAHGTGNPAPAPINPGQPQLHYPEREFTAWWPTRPRPRATAGTSRKQEEGSHERS